MYGEPLSSAGLPPCPLNVLAHREPETGELLPDLGVPAHWQDDKALHEARSPMLHFLHCLVKVQVYREIRIQFSDPMFPHQPMHAGVWQILSGMAEHRIFGIQDKIHHIPLHD